MMAGQRTATWRHGTGVAAPPTAAPCCPTDFQPAEHHPSLATDSPAGSVASSNLSRATAAGGGRGGSSVERLLYKALRALTGQVGTTEA